MTQIEKSNKIISTLVICLDIIIINLLFVAFRSVWLIYSDTPIIDRSIFLVMLSLTVSYLLSSVFSGAIFYFRRVRSDQIVRAIMKKMFLFVALWLLVSSIFDMDIDMNRPLYIYFVVTTIVIAALRLAYSSILKYLRGHGRNQCNVVYVGSGSNLRELYDEMSQFLTTGYNIIGYFDHAENPKFKDICRYLGRGEDVIEFLENNHIDRVYCSLPSKYQDTIIPIINYCEGHLIRFYSVPNFRNYCCRRVSLDMFSNVPLLTIREEPLSFVGNRFIKRSFDIIFSAVVLVAISVPCIIIAIVIKLTSPGPVFFTQDRDGLNGKGFKIYKFRTMRVNDESDIQQATKDDPRITKIGKRLRETSADELPQFINVLLGNMSVVGPRPHMKSQTKEYSELIEGYMVRHLVKPGITGKAQISGLRGETKMVSDMSDRVKVDIEYIEHWTFMLDLSIICKTVIDLLRYKKSDVY